MSDTSNDAADAVAKLLQSDPDQLYEELGLRKAAIQQNPAYAGAFVPEVTYPAEFAGPLNVLRNIGRRFFERFSRDAYNLVCGSDRQDEDERNKLLNAMNLGETAFAAALVGALVSTFGLAPALAAVVAALIVKLFFKNAYGATCEVWKQNLPKQA